MKELVELVVKGLVSKPETVEVTEHREGDHVLRYEVAVDPDDRGHVIGRQGATVTALRTLVGGVARRKGLRVEIDIVD